MSVCRARELRDILVEDGGDHRLVAGEVRAAIAERFGEHDRHATPLVALHQIGDVVADEAGNAAALDDIEFGFHHLEGRGDQFVQPIGAAEDHFVVADVASKGHGIRRPGNRRFEKAHGTAWWRSPVRNA